MLAVLNPAADRGDLLRAQSALAGKATVAALGLPRRHVAGLCDKGDLLGARVHILIAEQVKRSRASGPVAGGAVVKDDRRNIAVEGRDFSSTASKAGRD